MEDCQDGCNTRFDIPISTFILDDEKPEECVLYFEEDHVVIRRRVLGTSQENGLQMVIG